MPHFTTSHSRRSTGTTPGAYIRQMSGLALTVPLIQTAQARDAADSSCECNSCGAATIWASSATSWRSVSTPPKSQRRASACMRTHAVLSGPADLLVLAQSATRSTTACCWMSWSTASEHPCIALAGLPHIPARLRQKSCTAGHLHALQACILYLGTLYLGIPHLKTGLVIMQRLVDALPWPHCAHPHHPGPPGH